MRGFSGSLFVVAKSPFELTDQQLCVESDFSQWSPLKPSLKTAGHHLAQCEQCSHTGFPGPPLKSHIKNVQSTSVTVRTANRPATEEKRWHRQHPTPGKPPRCTAIAKCHDGLPCIRTIWDVMDMTKTFLSDNVCKTLNSTRRATRPSQKRPRASLTAHGERKRFSTLI